VVDGRVGIHAGAVATVAAFTFARPAFELYRADKLFVDVMVALVSLVFHCEFGVAVGVQPGGPDNTFVAAGAAFAVAQFHFGSDQPGQL